MSGVGAYGTVTGKPRRADEVHRATTGLAQSEAEGAERGRDTDWRSEPQDNFNCEISDTGGGDLHVR